VKIAKRLESNGKARENCGDFLYLVGICRRNEQLHPAPAFALRASARQA
jgi:hypothetical protein